MNQFFFSFLKNIRFIPFCIFKKGRGREKRKGKREKGKGKREKGKGKREKGKGKREKGKGNWKSRRGRVNREKVSGEGGRGERGKV